MLLGARQLSRTELGGLRPLLVFDGRALRARVTRHVERTIEGGTSAGELECSAPAIRSAR